jgi:putative DNA primase/helicase
VTEDLDRADELRAWYAEDLRNDAAAASNGRHPDDPGPVDPTPSGDCPTHSGQVRMAYRLGAAYRERLLYVHGIGWHFWDGKRWAEDHRGIAKRAVLAVLRNALADSVNDKRLRADVQRCESDAGINGTLGVAAALEPFAATLADLDPDPYLLNVANGVLDLRTMELSEHHPQHRITKAATAAYDPAAPAGRWSAFLERILPDPAVRDYMQRLAGVALVGSVIEHVLPILVGVGGNGKGTFYTALLHALGDYALAAEPNLLMHHESAHPTGEMDLRGKRFVVTSETQEGRRLNEATMKRLTGGDPIRARRMRQDFVQFDPSHTAVLVTNHLPLVSGDSKAVWDRLRVVPFNVTVRGTPDDDKQLSEKLRLDADAILSWAVAGWGDYQSRGGLDDPDAVRVATDEYQHDSDAVARFIADECVISSPVLKATTSQLFEVWQKWRPQEGVPEMSRKAFGQALDSHGYPVTDRARDGRWRGGIAVKAAEA